MVEKNNFTKLNYHLLVSKAGDRSRERPEEKLNDVSIEIKNVLILTAGEPVSGYFISRGQWIALIVRSYLHFLLSRSRNFSGYFRLKLIDQTWSPL